jgi:hypothetical protein
MGYKKVGQVDIYQKTGGGCFMLIVIVVILFLLSQGKC